MARYSANWSRWSPQFSLRTMFVAMVCCCIALGVWSAYLKPYVDQNAAIEAMGEAGATFQMEAAAGPDWQVWTVAMFAGPSAFVRVTQVDLTGSTATDATVSLVRYLPFLEQLTADHIPITPATMRALRGCSGLRTLSIRYTPCDDEFLKALAEHPSLKTLTLSGTQVSDDGLRSLRTMPQLREVFARWTGITTAGATRFEQEFPECKIYLQAVNEPLDSER